MQFRHIVAAVILGLCLGPVCGPASAQKLGMTPSHIYGIWERINEAVLALQVVRDGTDKPAKELLDMKPKSFANAKAADVMKFVDAFRKKVDVLRRRADLPPTKVYSWDPTQEISPSIVYQNSGFAQDSLMEWMISETNRDFLIAPYYQYKAFSDKTPSDVASLAELAMRRFTWILDNG